MRFLLSVERSKRIARIGAIMPRMAKRLEPSDEFGDISTERLLELREEYRAGQVKLVEREPDAEVRAGLNALNRKMLAAIEAEIEKRMSAQ
jgi:hypothetical protein